MSEVRPPVAISKRVFVVGCSRSGTTLLQGLIASHPGVSTFPETFFFLETERGQRFRPGASDRNRRALERLLKRVGREEAAADLPRGPIGLERSIDCFVSILDRIATDEGSTVWVEKSPVHLRFVRRIRRHVPGAHFVHILRDGREVVASIQDRALRFPERFGWELGADTGVRRWNRAIRRSAACLGQPDHSFVLFDRLVEETEAVLRTVFAELGLPGQDVGAVEEGVAERISRRGAGHLDGVRAPVQAPRDKFQNLFEPLERERIERRLDLNRYGKLREAVLRRVSSASH